MACCSCEDEEGEERSNRRRMAARYCVRNGVRGLPFMTSAGKGARRGVKKCTKLADKQYKLCEQRGGEGKKNLHILWTSLKEDP